MPTSSDSGTPRLFFCTLAAAIAAAAPLRQLSTLGRVPHLFLNSLNPFDFSELLLKYHSPFVLSPNRSVGGLLSSTTGPPAVAVSSSFRPFCLRNCFTSLRI